MREVTKMEDLANIKGRIFNIQGYSIHDGPGIRTTVFFLGCPLRCLWCQNPESATLEPKLFFITEKCVGCGRCVAACPNGAIELVDGKAKTDRSKCNACGACVKACPVEAREIVGETKTAEEVVKRVRQDELFYRTSGGGVTLSGGEVLMQPDFAYAILKLCKEAGLHTAIETCGCKVGGILQNTGIHRPCALRFQAYGQRKAQGRHWRRQRADT